MRRIFKNSKRTTKEWVTYLKCPSAKNKRSTFAVLKKWANGKQETLKLPEIEIINKQFATKVLSFEECRNLGRALVKRLNFTESAVLNNETNRKILEKYWAEEYEARDLVSHYEAWNRLYRAVEAVGHYSLVEATRTELQSEVDSRYQGNAQRKVVASLNQILKFLKRDFKLRKNREEIKPISYVTEKEFEKILASMGELPELKLIFQTAFATGMRVGEIFALEPDQVLKNHVLVLRQMDRDLRLRQTKTRKEYKTYFSSEHRKAIVEWAEFKDKQKLRNLEFSVIARRLSNAAIGRSITFHDLRHSYAINLLKMGISVSQISQFLGNSPQVCERYYSGYISSPETIEAVDRKVREFKQN